MLNLLMHREWDIPPASGDFFGAETHSPSKAAKCTCPKGRRSDVEAWSTVSNTALKVDQGWLGSVAGGSSVGGLRHQYPRNGDTGCRETNDGSSHHYESSSDEYSTVIASPSSPSSLQYGGGTQIRDENESGSRQIIDDNESGVFKEDDIRNRRSEAGSRSEVHRRSGCDTASVNTKRSQLSSLSTSRMRGDEKILTTHCHIHSILFRPINRD